MNTLRSEYLRRRIVPRRIGQVNIQRGGYLTVEFPHRSEYETSQGLARLADKMSAAAPKNWTLIAVKLIEPLNDEGGSAFVDEPTWVAFLLPPRSGAARAELLGKEAGGE